jgi:enoyl-CoA hydratase/carnithine racemase
MLLFRCLLRRGGGSGGGSGVILGSEGRRRCVVASGPPMPMAMRHFGSHNSDTSLSPSNRVITTVDDSTGIAHVILNRPEKLNALDLTMFHALQDAAQSLQSNASVRVIILRAQGRAFCTGLDVPSIVRNGRPVSTLHALLDRPSPPPPPPPPLAAAAVLSKTKGRDDAVTADDDDNDDTCDPPLSVDEVVQAMAATTNLVQQVAYLWRQLPVPVICAVHGLCYGGGLQIALGADIRLATSNAQLSIMESKWGLLPDMGATVTLRELLPIDVAKELTFTGRVVSGTEAARLGLVTRSVDVDNAATAISSSMTQKDGTASSKSTSNHGADLVLHEAMTLARVLIQKSPDALRLTKQLYQSTWRSGTSEEYCLQLETTFQRELIGTWNQMAAAGRNYGWKLPYFVRRRRE